jgi:nitrite reductase/ring-hydroxylating ferredoxin subunit
MGAALTTPYPLGPVEQIPIGEGREFIVGDRRVAVFRLRDGRLMAIDARCPHRDGPLADGLVGMDSVICPLHLRRFSLVTGDADTGDCAVAVYDTRLDDGQVVVEMPAT